VERESDIGSVVVPGALRRWRHGTTPAQLCAELGIRRATLYRWRERYDGTLFTDRGFEHVPALAPVADHLARLLNAA
jgi:hypothetical protein